MFTDDEKKYILNNAFADRQGVLCVSVSKNLEIYRKVDDYFSNLSYPPVDFRPMDLEIGPIENVLPVELTASKVLKFCVGYYNQDLENTFKNVEFYYVFEGVHTVKCKHRI